MLLPLTYLPHYNVGGRDGVAMAERHGMSFESIMTKTFRYRFATSGSVKSGSSSVGSL